MKFNTFFIFALTFLTSVSGWAQPVEEGVTQYQCQAFLPKADVDMLVSVGPDSIEIEMDFYNQGIQKVFPGTFKMSTQYFDSKKGQIVARGSFFDGPEEIKAVIQGAIKANDQGHVLLSIGAGWDHRIEYGYGNYLSCTSL